MKIAEFEEYMSCIVSYYIVTAVDLHVVVACMHTVCSFLATRLTTMSLDKRMILEVYSIPHATVYTAVFLTT